MKEEKIIEDKIISALIGLIGACENNPKTDHTDAIITKALSFPLLNPEYDSKKLQDMIDRRNSFRKK